MLNYTNISDERYNKCLYHLYCFTVVAKYPNYTEAAENLHMTQPALSKIVKTLEKNLGVNLFYRYTRKVELTEAGRLFLDRTISILNEWNDLVKEKARLEPFL